MIFPWEQPSHIEYKKYSKHPFLKRDGFYKAEFEILEDKKSSHKRGDVVKFGNGFYTPGDDWRDWFLMEGELDGFYPRNINIPKYARNAYAIILARYKWTKYKQYMTFRDYGCIIMMLTGPRVGHVRRYYAMTPYSTVLKYPYKTNPIKIKEAEIDKVIKILKVSNTKEDFLKTVYLNFRKE